MVEAVNEFGSTQSPTVTFRTAAGVPTGEMFLRAFNVETRSAMFAWNRPSSANGVIQKYELSSTTLRDPDNTVIRLQTQSLR